MTLRYLDVPGFEGYRISTDGLVESRKKVGPVRDQLADCWKPLRPSIDPETGYARVSLRRGGKTFRRYVHHLVLEIFVGPRPDGMEGCHDNGIRADNRLSNLRWDTPSANQMDRVAHGTSNRGLRQHMAKLTEADVLLLVEIKRETPDSTIEDLAMIFGVSKGTVQNILHGHNWSWLTGIKPTPRKLGTRPGRSRKHYRDLGSPGRTLPA